MLPLSCGCSAALLVRPCIDLFKEMSPDVTALIFTFLAFVFATAFTYVGQLLRQCVLCRIGRLART